LTFTSFSNDGIFKIKVYLILWVLLCAITFNINAEDEITITTHGPQKEDDASHDYFVSLLSLALNSADDDRYYRIKIVPHPGQGRVMRLIAKDLFYDVAWSGYSAERADNLIRVPFPLFKGGLGVRGSIVRRSDDWVNQIFDMRNIADKAVCQGIDWPDSEILKNNGLRVLEIAQFDSVLAMLELGRCDLFPLSVFEGQAELDLVQNTYPNLQFTTEFLITYYQEMNFYVTENNALLADRIFNGLSMLKSTGELNTFMQNHPLTKNAFPFSQFKHSVKIKLDSTLEPSALSSFYLAITN
jgi:hypothetical protein